MEFRFTVSYKLVASVDLVVVGVVVVMSSLDLLSTIFNITHNISIRGICWYLTGLNSNSVRKIREKQPFARVSLGLHLCLLHQ